MLHDQMFAAIDRARTLTRLDELSRTIWQAFSAGAVSDEQAQQLAERIHVVRGVTREETKPLAERAPHVAWQGRGTLFPPRRAQVSPDRAASRTRRRRLASAGPMPPGLAQGFTQGELAVLAILAAEVREKGLCAASLAELAARAGVGRTTAQNALREAARQGLITIQQRRRRGQKNDTNLVRIVSGDWLAWLTRRSESRSSTAASGRKLNVGSTGYKKTGPTDTQTKKMASKKERRTAFEHAKADRRGAQRETRLASDE